VVIFYSSETLWAQLTCTQVISDGTVDCTPDGNCQATSVCSAGTVLTGGACLGMGSWVQSSPNQWECQCDSCNTNPPPTIFAMANCCSVGAPPPSTICPSGTIKDPTCVSNCGANVNPSQCTSLKACLVQKHCVSANAAGLLTDCVMGALITAGTLGALLPIAATCASMLSDKGANVAECVVSCDTECYQKILKDQVSCIGNCACD